MRIWRSLDLLLAVVLSLIIGVLGMADLAGNALVSGATLATLGVLASGALAARGQMRDLTRSNAELAALTRHYLAETPPADRLLSTSTSGLDVDLTGATDIGIIGVTLSRTIRNHAVVLRECLRRGGTVRIAVIDPRSDVVDEAARRSTSPEAAGIFAHRLRPTLDLLGDLATAGRLEIRLLDFVPAYGLLAVDPGTPGGRLHVDLYSHTFGGREPSLTLRATHDPVWYPHFRAEFEQIWSAGHLPEDFVSGRQFY